MQRPLHQRANRRDVAVRNRRANISGGTMNKDKREKVDTYSMGELSQLTGRRMRTQVKKDKRKYTRKDKHKT
jgi:hypothetical protein